MVAELILAMALVPTDQTVTVAKGTKLDVNNFAGDVIVKVWDRDAVRVEATHSDRETVDIKQGDQVLSIRSRSTRGGPPRSLDYTITVPKWMATSVSGNFADVTMDGVGADVNVDTTRGDIHVTGGSGFVSLKSVQGEITLDKAKGRVEIRAVNEGIRLADINGDISAESTNGSIILDRIDSSNVDLYTVNGNISYDGPIKDKGLYRLTTHNGLIAMPIAEKANAAVSARTYNGGIRATFPLPNSDADRRTKRLALTVGNGSAHVELESFGGTISLRRPGEPRPETERRRTRERDKDKDKEKEKDLGYSPLGGIDLGGVQAEVARAMAEARPEIERAMVEAQPEIERAVNDAMREAAPEIDRAVNEAMELVNAFVFPSLVPDWRPRSTPAPRPKPRN